MRFSTAYGLGVRLWSVIFGNVQGNDGFRLRVDGSTVYSGDIPGTGTPSNYSLGPAGVAGNDFRIGVAGNNDDFFVRAVTVSAVPVPGAAALLTLGLLGLLSIRRRAGIA